MRRYAQQPWILLLAGLAVTASATGSAAWEGTEPSGRVEGLAWQIALEAQGFSPGLLDGLIEVEDHSALAATSFLLAAQRSHDLDISAA